MKELETYKRWSDRVTDRELSAELAALSCEQDQIKERFYSELSFGTAGLRGILGVGTNRMNIYTVGRATMGLAKYLVSKFKKPSAVIAYDSRNKSELFARITAEILANNGVQVYIFSRLTPVPVLSYAVREMCASAGVCITASHNPAVYNGYKVYGGDGAQLSPEAAQEVTENIKKIDYFDDILTADFDDCVNLGSVKIIGDWFLEQYLDRVQEQSVNKDICKNTPIKVVYTPLNGTGNIPVRKILGRIGVNDIHVVKEQEQPDGNFPTCPYPNPEFVEALKLALELSDSVKPDLCLATDPDCDRVGIAARKDDQMVLLSGNEVGVLLLNYLLEAKKKNGTLPKDPVAVSTVVSTPLTEKVAGSYGCRLINVLTGFKFIGGEVEKIEAQGDPKRFILGFEESYGYLAGNYARDKDGVVASMLICEMTAYYKSLGLSLYEAMDGIYKKFGYYINNVVNLSFDGISGMAKMSEIMTALRSQPPKEIAGRRVLRFTDILEGFSVELESGSREKIDLPASNVLIFDLEDGFKAIARPSGTEPKLKLYLTAIGKTRETAEQEASKLSNAMTELINII